MKYLKSMVAVGVVLFSGQTLALPNCPASNGNVDIFTRIVDIRSVPGSAGLDFKAVEKAMRSGGPGTFTAVCIEGHSNIPNSVASTKAEARNFGLKMRGADLAKGLPITIAGYGNKQPATSKPAVYVTASGERAQIALTPARVQQAILNHRIIVHYIYSCPTADPRTTDPRTTDPRNGTAKLCIAPFSGLSAGPLLSGATLTAPGTVAAVGGLSGAAIAKGAVALAIIAALIGSGGGTTGTTN